MATVIEVPANTMLADLDESLKALLSRELDRLGFEGLNVRLQVYVHHLESREGVVEWVKGSLLTDYEKRLPPELYQRFLERYRSALLPQLSETRPFFYPFKRILIWGRRG